MERGEGFDSSELATALSHYDLGVIHSIRRFRRGAVDAPKALIQCERGNFLLKRRRAADSDPAQVAFCHEVQLRLARRGFPLARLVGSRLENNSMLILEGGVYELFEFVRGQAFDGSPEASESAGACLARFHKAIADYRVVSDAGGRGYHDRERVWRDLTALEERFEAARSVREAYEQAAEAARGAGVEAWPRQVIHGDWHPGNMVFRGAGVAAGVDFDSVQVGARVMDLANGALQFSLLGGGGDPADWPNAPDEDRYLRFCHGYDHEEGCTISRAELAAMCPLMIEALVAEAVGPVAATGTFAGMDGGRFLEMVRRKADWLRANSDRLASLAGG